MNQDYTKFSLEKLDEWIHDLIHNEDVSPTQICDQLTKTLTETYEYHIKFARRCESLTEILSSQKKALTNQVPTMNYSEAIAAGWTMTDDGFWIPPHTKEDKVNRWILPVQQGSDDYFITLPDALLNTVDWSEGDTLEWTEGKNGSYVLHKVRPNK